MELVSVIVPLYNVEQYMDKCVESIVTQNYEHLEIILVDDGSPDTCPQKCDLWAQKDSRIKVIHKNNGGLSDARNRGIEIATGQYICFIDGDDWIEEDFVSDLLKLDADIAIAGTRLVDKKDNAIIVRGSNIILNSGEDAVDALLDGKIFPTACDKLYKAPLVKNILFEVGKIHEDEFWSWKVLLQSKKIVGTNKPLYNYLQHEQSIMGQTYSLKRLYGLEARSERMWYLQANTKLWNKTKKGLIKDCLYHMQCSIKYLKEDDLRKATIFINRVYKGIPNKYKSLKGNSLKEFVWLFFALISLKNTARLRNMLGIGF